MAGIAADKVAAELAHDDLAEQFRRVGRERDVARSAAVHYRDALIEARFQFAQVEQRFPPGSGATAAIAKIDAALTAIPEDKPRCRVVTSPRFYSLDDRSRAINALETAIEDTTRPPGGTRRHYLAQTVDIVAEALGMRRAVA